MFNENNEKLKAAQHFTSMVFTFSLIPVRSTLPLLLRTTGKDAASTGRLLSSWR
jgi:hypothetical protein